MNYLETKNATIATMECNLVPFIKGRPGCGKSDMVNSIAQEYNLELIDLRLSQCDTSDLNGLPWIENGLAAFYPFDIFPIESKEIPKGKEGFLLFLDELPNASIPVQQAAYQLILDRVVGNNKLHKNCVLIVAGNREIDNCFVNPMPNALKSRLIHFEMDTNYDDWFNWAITSDIDYRITSYLNYDPSKLDTDVPTEDTYPCPRSWSFCSKLIKDREVSTLTKNLITGAIGVSAAANFISFLKHFDEMVPIKDIIASPLEAPVSDKASVIYATLGSIVSNFNRDTIKPLTMYLGRFPTEFQFVAFKEIQARYPELAHDKDLTAAHIKVAKELYDPV